MSVQIVRKVQSTDFNVLQQGGWMVPQLYFKDGMKINLIFWTMMRTVLSWLLPWVSNLKESSMVSFYIMNLVRNLLDL